MHLFLEIARHLYDCSRLSRRWQRVVCAKVAGICVRGWTRKNGFFVIKKKDKVVAKNGLDLLRTSALPIIVRQFRLPNPDIMLADILRLFVVTGLYAP